MHNKWCNKKTKRLKLIITIHNQILLIPIPIFTKCLWYLSQPASPPIEQHRNDGGCVNRNYKYSSEILNVYEHLFAWKRNGCLFPIQFKLYIKELAPSQSIGVIIINEFKAISLDGGSPRYVGNGQSKTAEGIWSYIQKSIRFYAWSERMPKYCAPTDGSINPKC